MKRLSGIAEHIHADNSILRRENTELKSVIRTRKERLSGKRIILRGKFIVSTEEVQRKLAEAERKTKEKKTKNRHIFDQVVWTGDSGLMCSAMSFFTIWLQDIGSDNYKCGVLRLTAQLRSLCCVYYVVFLRLNCSADANLHGFIWIHLYESLRWNSRVVVSVWCVYIPNARCAHGPPLLLHTLPSGSDSKNICSHN